MHDFSVHICLSLSPLVFIPEKTIWLKMIADAVLRICSSMCGNKDATSCTVNSQLISDFVFASKKELFLYFVFKKVTSIIFSHLTWLNNLVCVEPGLKSQTGSDVRWRNHKHGAL